MCTWLTDNWVYVWWGPKKCLDVAVSHVLNDDSITKIDGNILIWISLGFGSL